METSGAVGVDEGPASAKLQNGGSTSEPKFITERAPIVRREKLSQAVYDNILNIRVEKSNYLESVRGKELVPGKDMFFFIFNDGTETSNEKEEGGQSGEEDDEEEVDPLDAFSPKKVLPEACEGDDVEKPADAAWIDDEPLKEDEESANGEPQQDADEEMDQGE